MDYGWPSHAWSAADLTVLQCRACGWHSGELTRADMLARGLPWYCDACDRQVAHFTTFHPAERSAAYAAMGIGPEDSQAAKEHTL